MGFSRQEYCNGLHFLLQGIFLTQGLYPGLLHCRWILYHLTHQGSPDSAIVMYFSGNLWVFYENPGGYAKVHPKGNQSWVFIGKIDAEAETPVLWPPDVKS